MFGAGDELLKEGVARAEVFEKKDNLYSIRQNLTREVRWSDNGKELRCVAAHPIIGMDPARTTARKRINVKCTCPTPSSQLGDIATGILLISKLKELDQ